MLLYTGDPSVRDEQVSSELHVIDVFFVSALVAYTILKLMVQINVVQKIRMIYFDIFFVLLLKVWVLKF